MTIREELLSIGFSEEYIDEEAKKIFENRLPKKKKLSDTRIYKAVTTNYLELLMRKLAWKMYQREENKKYRQKIEQIRKQGFTGDKNNSIDVLKYEQSLNNSPIKTEEYKEDDCTVYIHTYADGLKATVRTHLSGIPVFDSKEIEINNKRLLADYMKMDESQILEETDENIDKMVKKYSREMNRRN